ncbi:MAG: hypothetical protein D6776_08500 [Planctomycetota bacterium]|nr:MAG: hypothetical protein D6776_08500 [Planctomycetota bacterium]
MIEAHGGRIELRNRVAEADGTRLGLEVTVYIAASPIGPPNLANLTLRSVLFEDLRPLAIRGADAHALRRATSDAERDCERVERR